VSVALRTGFSIQRNRSALDTLTADQAATFDAGNSATVKRDNSKLVVANLMRQLAAYVTVACKGDLHNLILSGFPPQKTTRTPVGVMSYFICFGDEY
jgi:hypothetical protein